MHTQFRGHTVISGGLRRIPFQSTDPEKVFERLSSRDLEEKIILAESKLIAEGKGVKSLYFYGRDLDDTHALINNKVKSDDVVLIMGAGDIDSIARKLV